MVFFKNSKGEGKVKEDSLSNNADSDNHTSIDNADNSDDEKVTVPKQRKGRLFSCLPRRSKNSKKKGTNSKADDMTDEESAGGGSVEHTDPEALATKDKENEHNENEHATHRADSVVHSTSNAEPKNLSRAESNESNALSEEDTQSTESTEGDVQSTAESFGETGSRMNGLGYESREGRKDNSNDDHLDAKGITQDWKKQNNATSQKMIVDNEPALQTGRFCGAWCM